jgi:hypothetical protein
VKARDHKKRSVLMERSLTQWAIAQDAKHDRGWRCPKCWEMERNNLHLRLHRYHRQRIWATVGHRRRAA